MCLIWFRIKNYAKKNLFVIVDLLQKNNVTPGHFENSSDAKMCVG